MSISRMLEQDKREQSKGLPPAPVEREGDSTAMSEMPAEESKKKAPSAFSKKEAGDAFLDIWKTDASKLHDLSLSRDLKHEVWRRAGEQKEAAQSRQTLDKKLKDMTLFNSGRTEKSRREHLSNATQGYEKASLALERIKAERQRIDADAEAADTYEKNSELSERIMKNVEEAEKTIALMFSSQAEALKAEGKRDEKEKKALAEMKEKQARMLLNLYHTESRNPHILLKHKEELMHKALSLQIYQDATRVRLSFSSEEDVRDFDQYKELSKDEIFAMSEANTYNTDAKKIPGMWAFFDQKYIPYGFKYGYICTGNSFLVNRYIRAKRQMEQAKAGIGDMKAAVAEMEALDRAIVSRTRIPRNLTEKQRKEYIESAKDKWKKNTEKLLAELDRATGTSPETDSKTDSETGGRVITGNRIPHKCKVYRMVTSDVLDWGLHLSKEEQSLNQAELTELINRRTGMGFADPGYMSTGWCVDKAFATRPFMLTLLTDEGKRCFVTKNFKEGEIIFGRNTRYMLVRAINHEHDKQTLKLSRKDTRDSVGSAKGLETDVTDFSGIELVMKVMPDDTELMEQARLRERT